MHNHDKPASTEKSRRSQVQRLRCFSTNHDLHGIHLHSITRGKRQKRRQMRQQAQKHQLCPEQLFSLKLTGHSCAKASVRDQRVTDSPNEAVPRISDCSVAWVGEFTAFGEHSGMCCCVKNSDSKRILGRLGQCCDFIKNFSQRSACF